MTEHYLAKTEYIMEVQLSTYKAKVGWFDYRTRIGWLRFITSTGRNFECGVQDDKGSSIHILAMYNADLSSDPNHTYHTFKRDQSALLYMSGSSGHAIDALTGHFVDVKAY